MTTTQETPDEIIARLTGVPIVTDIHHSVADYANDIMERTLYPEKFIKIDSMRNDHDRYFAIVESEIDLKIKLLIINDITSDSILAMIAKTTNEKELQLKAVEKIQDKNLLKRLCFGYNPKAVMVAATARFDPDINDDLEHLENVAFGSGEMEARIMATEMLPYEKKRLKLRKIADTVKNESWNTAQNEAAIKKLTRMDIVLLKSIAKGNSSLFLDKKHYEKTREAAKERLMQLSNPLF